MLMTASGEEGSLDLPDAVYDNRASPSPSLPKMSLAVKNPLDFSSNALKERSINDVLRKALSSLLPLFWLLLPTFPEFD